jgi:hypothetical protein
MLAVFVSKIILFHPIPAWAESRRRIPARALAG